MPIFRPLIGLHKEEITADAQRIGTYETSIIPDEDCCTLFTPRYPTTGARPGQARLAETDLDVSALVERAIADASVEDFSYPELPSKAEPAAVTPVINLAASIERIIPGDD
jgi:thiamine biosynthesis protein ThiI